MNSEGDNNKGASEYKPKSFGQNMNNAFNPYANNYNMYNPYGGYDNNMNMGNYQQNQNTYQYGGHYQDPNMMYQNYYQNYQQFGYQQNPNAINNQQQAINNTNVPSSTSNTTQPQNNNNKNITTTTAPKGIAGLPGVKTPQDNKTTKTTTNTTTANKSQATTSQVNKNASQNSQTKPGTAAKKTEDKKIVTTAPKITAQQPKKDEPKKAEEAGNTESKVAEISNNMGQIEINPESNLVDDSKEGAMIEVDTTRKPVNLIFIGHVDAGKSTISGSILLKTGMIDERTIEKYQRLAKANNRESWFIAYITDENEEERERGKTVEVGKAYFNTPTKRYTILDAPGHAGYVPNMLLGACQADFAGLVISAKQGEFEAGFEGEGRTREHALLAKSLGVTKLVVIINKMDEDTVRWSKERYDKIKTDLSGYLKLCGYNIEKHVYWIPISGLKGDNLATPVDKHTCPWYEGPTLLEILDSLETPDRKEDASVRIPILDKYKEQGIYLLGKIESGIVKYGATYTIMPSKINFEVGWLFNTEERGVPYAKPGECIRIKVKGIENENDFQRGNIICSPEDLCPIFNCFEAEMQILDIPSGKKGIMANGYSCILHYHTIVDEVTIDLLCEIDRKTKTEKKVKFLRSQTRAKVIIKSNNVLCGEKFEKFPSLGRFTLRDEGKYDLFT